MCSSLLSSVVDIRCTPHCTRRMSSTTNPCQVDVLLTDTTLPRCIRRFQLFGSFSSSQTCESMLVIGDQRSLKLEVQIYSPSVKVRQGNGVGGSLVPVFSDNDKIEGKITLDQSCHHSGTLSISVWLALYYRSIRSN